MKLKDIISENKSINEADVVGKTIFSDGKGKLHFGYYKTDDAVEFVDYKTWKKLSFKDVSKGDTNKDRVINSILKNQKQFNKKVDYNMWAKKTNPSFEQKMDWFIQNGWISNINKGGIKESVESVNEVDEIDTVTMDIPLFIRTLEYAREDAKTDMDLHDFAENAISLSKELGKLTMDSYDKLIGDKSVNEANIDVDVYRKKQAFVIGPKFAEIASDKDVELMARLKIANSEHAWQLKQNISSMDHLYKKYKIRSKKGVEESIVNEAKAGEFEIGDFVHFKSKNKTGMVKQISGDKVTIMTMKGDFVGDMKDIKVLYQDNLNEENPCWKGYEQIGMKMKDGKEVPNCVPKNESIKLTNILKEWRAEEVLQQLGGRKFIAMTGAKNFVKNDKDKSIVFRVPKAKNSINTIRITLTSMDLYNVEFISVRGTNIKTVATEKGVYNDQLQAIFTKYTGLNTSL